MTERILYATMAWFEATPSGRLINRFSQDISTIDTGVMSRLQVRGDKRRGGGGRDHKSGRLVEEARSRE